MVVGVNLLVGNIRHGFRTKVGARLRRERGNVFQLLVKFS